MQIKKFGLTIVFCLFIFLPLRAEKRRVQNNVIDKHYWFVSAQGGYYSLIEHFDDLDTKGGLATSLSGGYQFEYSGLWLTIGADVQFWKSNALTRDYQYDQQMLDTQGKRMTYHFDLSQSQEIIYGTNISLPIMIGYTKSGFYIGAGVKVGYNLFAQNRTSRDYFTYATYDQYFEDFVQMPNHFYTNYNSSNKESIKMGLPLFAIGEIGYDVLYNYSQKIFGRDKILRIGAYFDYGLLNAISTAEDKSLFDTNLEHPTTINVYPYYNRRATTSQKIIPFSAGIKLTFMLRIPTRNCNCD